MYIYNVMSVKIKRACLLAWVGSETYVLIENLFGDGHVADEFFAKLIAQLSLQFKDTVHIQAAAFAFYNCYMQPG